MKVLKIVLTGGPRAGKTSLIPIIKEKLEKQENSYVIIVPETATELAKMGIRPSTDKEKTLVFQDIIYTLQKAKEDAIEKIIKTYPDNSKVYVIFDRGILDNRAYLNEEEFDDILNCYNDAELRIVDNYDAVYGLCSSSHIEGQYETESNEARYEDEEEAKCVDDRTIESWKLHRNYKIIDATDSFKQKENLILQSLTNLCEEKDKKTFRRFIFNEPFDMNILKKYNAKKIQGIDYYMNYYDKNILFIGEKRKYKDFCSYNMKLKTYDNDKEITFKEKTLSDIDFNDLLNYNKIDRIIYKTVYTFINNRQVWRLILSDGKYFLEVETSLQHPEITLPKELNNAIEISNEVYYDIISNLGYKRTLKL
ncbi:MAG: AAA family ATPase [Bacilli bacterium]|nr:AAA family ATPase [Bacilli bacterium]